MSRKKRCTKNQTLKLTVQQGAPKNCKGEH